MPRHFFLTADEYKGDEHLILLIHCTSISFHSRHPLHCIIHILSAQVRTSEKSRTIGKDPKTQGSNNAGHGEQSDVTKT